MKLKQLWRLVALLFLRPGPVGTSAWLYNLARVTLLGGYAYFFGVLFLIAEEDRIAFNNVSAASSWRPWRSPPPGLNPQDVEFTSADGTRLHDWWSTPPNWTLDQGALLSCHGKGGNLSFVGAVALKWREQLNVAVLLFDYPGYGRSDGQPSEQGFYDSADAAYNWIRDVQHVPAQCLLIHGQSLGGGVAVNLAARKPHRALILTSTFTSFPDAAQSTVPFAPARWLAHNQFNSLDKIAGITTPVFIAHGTADRTIPYWQGERLFAAVKSEHKRFLRVEDGSHALDHNGVVHQAVRDFLLESEPLAENPSLP